MRILLGSDLHTQNPPLPDPSTYDVIVLPGDNFGGLGVFRWAKENVPSNKKVLVLPGNHEYDGYIYQDLRSAFYRSSNDQTVSIDRGSYVIGDYMFIGATLWSDLPPLTTQSQNSADEMYGNNLSDFWRIVVDLGDGSSTIMTPEIMRKLHAEERKLILDHVLLAKSRGLKPIVVTHFSPTTQFIQERFKDDDIRYYFNCDMSDIMAEGVPLWLFGHTHQRGDWVHKPSGTRVVTNAVGWPEQFDGPFEWKVIDTNEL